MNDMDGIDTEYDPQDEEWHSKLEDGSVVRLTRLFGYVSVTYPNRKTIIEISFC